MSSQRIGDCEMGLTTKLSFQAQDESGNGVPAANLVSLTLTVYAVTVGYPIVNGLNKVSILNDGTRGVVDASGNVTLTMLPADMVMVTGNDREDHIALIEWTYNTGGAKHGEIQIVFAVLFVRDQ